MNEKTMDLSTITRTVLMALVAIGVAESAVHQVRPIFEATEEVIPILGNPFGGGTPDIVKRNIKEHVSNQQRIYDRERSERMKAQRMKMRSMKPQDSYLRAYQEQHEQFHIDLERKMTEQMNRKVKKPENHFNSTKYTQNVEANFKHPRNRKQNVFRINEAKNDNRIHSSHTTERVRNKRLDLEFEANKEASDKVSRSVEYAPGYFLPMKSQQTQYFTRTSHIRPQPKPVAQFIPSQKFSTDDLNGLTYAALNQYSDNTQYSQLGGYQKMNGDIETSLTSLIGKQPDDQLKGLTYLLQQSSSNHKVTGEDLKNTNINLKASSIDVPQEYYETFDIYKPFSSHLNSYQQQVYAQDVSHQIKDHTPITENEEETVDVTAHQVHAAPPTRYTFVNSSPVTTSATNYYKVEVGNQLQSTVSTEDTTQYEPSPSHSYTLGHDNVSIEVKDNPDPVKSYIDHYDRPKESENNEPVSNSKENVYDKTIPYGTKLRTKNTKRTRSKRQIVKSNYRGQFFPRVNKLNQQNTQITKLTPHISNTQLLMNFTNSHTVNNNNRLKTSIANSFSLNDNLTQFSNYILRNLSSRVNCSECFKANGDSEFYYYEDITNNGTDSSMEEDFPIYDEVQQDRNKTQKSKLTLKAITVDSRETVNPHSEPLRLKFLKRPKLFRVVNGMKMRVMSPNPARYRKFLIKKPMRMYYFRYANDFDNMDYDSYKPRGSFVGNNYFDEVDYEDDYSEEYYDEEEMLANDDPYEEYASQSQYASGYSNYDDFISIDTYQNRLKNNRYNPIFSRGRGRHRYASGYEDDTDHINDDVYNDYTRNLRGKYKNQRYPSFNDNYEDDYSQNISDNYDDVDGTIDVHYNKGGRHRGQESRYQNFYSDKGYTDSYGNYHSSDGNKKKKQDPSNFYVENYNQYLSKPAQHSYPREENGHQKPISVFNIFRSESPHKSKPQLIEDGDVIHIDNYNVFPHGKHKIGWKGAKKPPRHLRYRPHRPVKHKRRKPSKWRRPRPFFHRRSSSKKKYHMLTNLSKINRKVPH